MVITSQRGGAGSADTTSRNAGKGSYSSPNTIIRSGGSGSIVVTHTQRLLKAYNFTDADLETISLSNVVSGISFSVAAAVFTFCIDINKDVIMASGSIPPNGLALQLTVNWLGLPLAAILALVGIYAQWKRGNTISRVKSESTQA